MWTQELGVGQDGISKSKSDFEAHNVNASWSGLLGKSISAANSCKAPCQFLSRLPKLCTATAAPARFAQVCYCIYVVSSMLALFLPVPANCTCTDCTTDRSKLSFTCEGRNGRKGSRNVQPPSPTGNDLVKLSWVCAW